MDMTREIYWNVGHGVLVPMYLLATVAIAVLVYGFVQRSKVWKRGKPLDRLDDRTSRVTTFIKLTILQSKVLSEMPGRAHALFFWGFLLLFVGTLLVFLQADITAPLLGITFLKGTFYLLFSVVLDVAGLLCMLGLSVLIVRRYLFRPDGLDTRWDHAFMHLLLFVIILTGFAVEGYRMAVTEVGLNPELAQWSPVGLVFAKLFQSLPEETLRMRHEMVWWFHFALVLVFFVAIPFTLFRHLFTTPVNYLFEDRRKKGSIDTINLEEEGVETFGVGKVEEFFWKDLYDASACTLCKRCQDRCPAYATGKPLSPMKLINDIGAFAESGKEEGLADAVNKEALWACTTCRACQSSCPASIEHVNKIIGMRRALVLMEGEFPGDEVQGAVEQIEVNGNPLGMTPSARGDWAKELGIPVMKENADVDLLYFVGCYASFDKRNIKVAKAFMEICKAAGVRVGILGSEEKCCGEPARKLGNEYLYQSVATENIETFKGYGVKKIVTACPHCYNTLSRDYRDLGFEGEVEHHTVFIDRLVKEGNVSLEPSAVSATLHDSCYLGRYQDIYGEPRDLLKASGAELTEMDKHFCESFCCGAGGGRILADEKTGTRISSTRVQMAAKTGAELLASACPFCLTMFEDGIKTEELEGKMKPLDVAEIVASRLKKPA